MINQLINRVRIRQTEIQVSLAKGNMRNWETYQRVVGEHNGLQEVIEMIDYMMKEEEKGSST